MESFTTRGLPARRKLAYWNALNSQSFAVMDIFPRNIASFDGDLRREPIGPLTILDVHSAAVHIRHTRSHAARTTEPSYLLLTPLRGDFELRLGANRANSVLRVAAGEYCLLDHAEPYELEHGDDVRTLCLDIPRGTFNTLLARPEDAVGRVMRADTGLSRLLPVLLREVGVTIQPPARSHLGPALAQGLLGFLAAAYTEEIETLPSAAATRRQALLNCIDARLHQQGLAPATIAREVGLSPRRLRALLASGGESFSSYILRRRLERCAALLLDPHWLSRSITDIAFRNGFNNMTHFGYAFKKRFGHTPSHHRATASHQGRGGSRTWRTA
jgi:AraC-like DNA-binding protein